VQSHFDVFYKKVKNKKSPEIKLIQNALISTTTNNWQDHTEEPKQVLKPAAVRS
jgi:hypothetical protein